MLILPGAHPGLALTPLLPLRRVLTPMFTVPTFQPPSLEDSPGPAEP